MSSTNINDTESGEVLRTVRLLKKAYRDCKRSVSNSQYNCKWTDQTDTHLVRVAKICLTNNLNPEQYIRLSFINHQRQAGPFVNELWNHELVNKIIGDSSAAKHKLKRIKEDGTTEEMLVGAAEYAFAGQVSNILLTMSKYIGSGVMKDTVREILLNPGFQFHPVAVYIVGIENEEVRSSIKQEAQEELKNNTNLVGTLQLLGYGTILGELLGE